MTQLKLSRPNIDETAISKVAEVLRSGNLVHGAVGREFEAAIAAFVGTSHAVVVSSGTAAIYLALRGLGIGPGDAVLVPDFTFPATANAVVMVGATPVLVDVDPKTYCMTPAAAEAAINAFSSGAKLAAILLVHEFGTPCDMLGFRALSDKYCLKLVEDAACALGARTSFGMVGKGSDVACFSFHPRKTLTTGEGGALVTDDPVLADRFRVHRNHGMQPAEGGVAFVEAALNFRLTDFQSALGLSQLPHLPGWIESRRQLVERYLYALAPLEQKGYLTLPALVDGQSWQTFMIVLDRRFDQRSIIVAMGEQGIETNLGAQCLGDTQTHRAYRATLDESVAQRLAKQGLALPLCETMHPVDIDRVTSTLARCLEDAS
ncbi:MAG: DegT/DnrJ/EryC1/StrS family aminotransferase [Rhodobacteraceae bacterium]|nr:DegT/DnrJ/EryC1/StrS family aminotransferase [Paracoccaceae bacterium]